MFEQSRICKGCWQQMRMPVPLHGMLSIPFRMVGIKPSRMNPNTCTVCELMFKKVMKARKVTIDATVLFADLRDYTGLSQTLSADEMSGVLDTFYDECAAAIWEHDGLLNKTIGDAVMAIFNFPIRDVDHAARAVNAARDIQRTFMQSGFGVGIGLHTGELSFGEFGRSHRDLTAIGTVVNIAARAQSVAVPGQILVTQAVRDKAAVAGDAHAYTLKGFETPVDLYAV